MILHILLYFISYIAVGSFISGAVSNWPWYQKILARPPKVATISLWPLMFLYLAMVQVYFLGIFFAERMLEIYNGYKISK
jgi:hypothetical protein